MRGTLHNPETGVSIPKWATRSTIPRAYRKSFHARFTPLPMITPRPVVMAIPEDMLIEWVAFPMRYFRADQNPRQSTEREKPLSVSHHAGPGTNVRTLVGGGACRCTGVRAAAHRFGRPSNLRCRRRCVREGNPRPNLAIRSIARQ